MTWYCACTHDKTGMNKRKLILSTVSLLKSAHDDDDGRYAPSINRGNRWLCVGTRNETRYYCSFIGDRFPAPLFSTGRFSYRTGRRQKSCKKNGLLQPGSRVQASSFKLERSGEQCGGSEGLQARPGCADTYPSLVVRANTPPVQSSAQCPCGRVDRYPVTCQSLRYDPRLFSCGPPSCYFELALPRTGH